MKRKLSKEESSYFWDEVRNVLAQSRMGCSKQFFQHGKTTVYSHSVHVAYASYYWTKKYHIEIDDKALIRGALLHDYFLYDWHDKEHAHKRPHGFYHPSAALNNALEDFNLSSKEKNIIKRHMFPLTIMPPTCREAWIVCMADKVCGLRETIAGRKG